MSRKQHTRPASATHIRLLAYAHRYAFPVLAILLPVLLARSKTQALLGMGIGLTFYGVYTLLGYRLRWKHIYCSWQDVAHQKMTPANIQWKNVRKVDLYGLSAVCIGFGLLVVVVSVFVL